MEFRFKDGRSDIYQWDKDVILVVNETISQLHFRVSRNEAWTLDVIEGECEVPPELLQNAGNITFYSYGGNKTMDAASFEVIRRPKPDDYIYTPTEKKTWEALDERIQHLEEHGVGSGGTGADGKSAYEIAVENGFVGTEVEWLESLKGADGATGPAGADGKDGATGPQGVPGADGKDGQDGNPGADGYTPVKGTDYWTDADKTEMVNEVIEALPENPGGPTQEEWSFEMEDGSTVTKKVALYD